MRIILSNEDADRLVQLLDNPDLRLRIQARKRVGEGGTVWVLVDDVEPRGEASRTPSRAGTLRIEDLDGRIIWEGPPGSGVEQG